MKILGSGPARPFPARHQGEARGGREASAERPAPTAVARGGRGGHLRAQSAHVPKISTVWATLT